MTVTVQTDQEAKAQIVAALKDRLSDRLLAVVLFGSRARGMARQDSDWDVLVIASGLPEEPYERLRMLSTARPNTVPDVVIVLRDLETFTHSLQSLSLDLALDGEILYDPQGVAGRRLAALRRLIRAEGLRRKHTPAGDLWTWREPPADWPSWRGRLELTDDPEYRSDLATRHLAEAQKLFGLEMWSSSVDHSQMSAENVAKAVLALVGPVGRTHEPGLVLQALIGDGRFPSAVVPRVQRLAECARLLGSEIHMFAAYGDEEKRLTPWDLFAEDRARELLDLAEEAVHIAQELVATP